MPGSARGETADCQNHEPEGAHAQGDYDECHLYCVDPKTNVKLIKFSQINIIFPNFAIMVVRVINLYMLEMLNQSLLRLSFVSNDLPK